MEEEEESQRRWTRSVRLWSCRERGQDDRVLLERSHVDEAMPERGLSFFNHFPLPGGCSGGIGDTKNKCNPPYPYGHYELRSFSSSSSGVLKPKLNDEEFSQHTSTHCTGSTMTSDRSLASTSTTMRVRDRCESPSGTSQPPVPVREPYRPKQSPTNCRADEFLKLAPPKLSVSFQSNFDYSSKRIGRASVPVLPRASNDPCNNLRRRGSLRTPLPRLLDRCPYWEDDWWICPPAERYRLGDSANDTFRESREPTNGSPTSTTSSRKSAASSSSSAIEPRANGQLDTTPSAAFSSITKWGALARDQDKKKTGPSFQRRCPSEALGFPVQRNHSESLAFDPVFTWEDFPTWNYNDDKDSYFTQKLLMDHGAGNRRLCAAATKKTAHQQQSHQGKPSNIHARISSI